MTADIVNLRKVRKTKARAEAQKEARENAMKFGRTKAERAAAAALLELGRKRLDGAIRDTAPAALANGEDPGPGNVP